MWKFIEDLRKDFDKVKDDVEHRETTEAEKKQTEDAALEAGTKAIEGNKIIALQDGTIEMINQNEDSIELYFDNGHGLGIRFPFGPRSYKVLVSANQKVKKGEPLVEFGPDTAGDTQVYAFTPDMIKTLANANFRIE